MSAKSLINQRLKYCYDKAKAQGSDQEYSSLNKKMAAVIRNNGLGNFFAFLKSKSKTNNEKNAYNHIHDHLKGWLKGELKLSYIDSEDLITAYFKISDQSELVYYLTEECLQYFATIKLFLKD
jgi:CRISPR type III-B/RAMP module-associated protein Cmr5